MNTKILNYRVIIEPDRETGTDKPGFTAYCPTLGIADDGDTVDEALENIKAMIEFHLNSLKEEGKDIPKPDSKIAFFANFSFPFKFTSKKSAHKVNYA